MTRHRYCLHRSSYWLFLILCFVTIKVANGAQNSVIVWGSGDVTNVPADVTNVASVATAYDCVALLRDGRLRKWGSGNTNVPPAATNVIAVSAAGNRFVALRRDGFVFDQQGVFRTSNAVAVAAADMYGAGAVRSNGVFVGWDGLWSPANNTSNAVALAKAGYATLRVLLSDGTVNPVPSGLSATATGIVAMADGNYPVFLKGDGTVISSSSQGGVLTSLSNVVAVASGSEHGLALKSDGSVAAWSGNSSSQTNVPAGLSNVVAIAAGGYHSLALRADGTVVAWGSNSSGQTNVPAALTNASAVFAGPNYSVAIVGDSPPILLTQPRDQTAWSGLPVTFTVSASGSLPLHYQWQYNGEIIGNATNSVYRIDSAAPKDSGVYNVVVSNARGTAMSRDATLVVWPDPYFTVQPTNQTALLGDNATFRTLAVGSQPVSYQWFFEGNLIPGATNSILTLTNIGLGEAGHYWVTANDAFGVQTSAVVALAPGAIAAWGNPSGGLNEVPDNLLNIAAITAGGNDSFALKPDGTVVLWGVDDNVSPNMATGLSNVSAIAAGYQFIVALFADGHAESRGANGTYVPPPGVPDLVSISAGVYHSLGLRRDGSVIASGGGGNVPVGLSNVVAVAAGGYHSLALRADGTMVAWGLGESGQTNIPPGLSDVVAIAAGGHHSLALRDDGRVLAWGNNSYGQTNIPAGVSNIIAIAAGFSHSLALRDDGTVAAWGANDYLQSSVPPNLRDVVAIAAGHSHSIAMLAGGLVAPPIQAANATRSGSEFFLQTSTFRGKSYYLQHRDAFSATQWTLHPPVPGDGTLQTLVDPNAIVPQRFYRVWQKP
jgi:alpha-tubulin suppressor-like RCC1 family protein